MNIMFLFLFFFIVVNVSTFFFMGWDKVHSKKIQKERISEGLLFFLASIGGGIGIYLGMFFFRHKTRKWYFILGIPFILLQSIVFWYTILFSMKM
ncbi:MAG: DUF1294 domain-containing protein [Candidatus Moranbacteria bacterium]|nr:DUF1294 domain-containing protein [Candidatus Moranbacteria bacterium]